MSGRHRISWPTRPPLIVIPPPPPSSIVPSLPLSQQRRPPPPPPPVLLFHQRTERRLMAAEAEAKAEVGGEERWVGLAVDFSEGSRAALKWTADNLLRSGDNLLLLHVLKDPNYEQGETLLWEASGSPLIPLSEFSEPVITKKYGVKPDAETLDMLNTVARQKEVMVVSKVLYGDPREKLCQAVHDIPMSCLVIGSRGLGKLKRVLLGSVSDFVVNNATCPVTVVKPATVAKPSTSHA